MWERQVERNRVHADTCWRWWILSCIPLHFVKPQQTLFISHYTLYPRLVLSTGR